MLYILRTLLFAQGLLISSTRTTLGAAHPRTWKDWKEGKDFDAPLVLRISPHEMIWDVADRFCNEQRLSSTQCVAVQDALIGNYHGIVPRTVSPALLTQEVSVDRCGYIPLEFDGVEYQLVTDVHDNATSMATDVCNVLSILVAHRPWENDSYSDCIIALTNRVASMFISSERVEGGKECAAAQSRRLHGFLDKQEPRNSILPNKQSKEKSRVRTWAECEQTIPGQHHTTCLYHGLIYAKGSWVATSASGHGLDKEEGMEESLSRFPSVTVVASRGDAMVEDVFMPEVWDAGRILDTCPMMVHDSTLHIIISRWQPGVFGHQIHDTLIPLFWAMDALSEVTRDNQVVFIDEDSPTTLDELLLPMSNNAPLYKRELPWKLCPQHTCCRFDKVLVGYMNMGLVGPEVQVSANELQARSVVYRKFRRFYLDGVSALHRSADPPRLDPLSVIIVQRANYRQILNTDEVVAELIRVYPHATVTVLQLEKMSLPNQVKLLQETSILIAVEGSALDGLLLARPGMGVLAIARDTNLPWPEGSQGNKRAALHHRHVFEVLQGWLVIEVLDTPPGSHYLLDVEEALALVARILRRQSSMKLHYEQAVYKPR